MTVDESSRNDSGRTPHRRVTPAGPPGAFVPEEPRGSVVRAAGETGGGPRKRSADVFSVASLLAYLPYLLMSLALVVQLGSVPGLFMGSDVLRTVGGYVVLAAWLACGGLLIWNSAVETFLVRFAEGARPPTEAEHAQLAAVWSDVTEAAGVEGSAYQLWVQDSDELNAAALSGHIVTVTRGALQTMPPRHLAAVLAHELGHHLAGHAWVGALSYWYCLPSRLLIRMLGLMGRLFAMLLGVGATIAAMTTRLGVFGLLVFRPALFLAKLFLFFMYAPLIAMVVVPVFLAKASDRFAELRADRLAVDLGYGPALAEVFANWAQEEAGGPTSMRDRLLATHPPLHKRITKINERLRSLPS